MFSLRYSWSRKLHPSVFIAWLSAALIGGVVLSAGDLLWLKDISWFILGFILVLIVFVHRTLWLIVVIIVAGLFLGAWRGALEQGELRGYKSYINSSVILSGVINEDPKKNIKRDTQIQLREVKLNGQSMTGMVWVSTHSSQVLKRSDKIEVSGKLREGFGNFGASMTYAKIDNHISSHDPAREMRDWFASIVRRFIKEPEASLGIGFLVGQRSQLPAELDENLRIAGLTHIVVASGYNLTILVRLSRRFFEKISKYLTALSSSFLIIGFILVTGFSPSMTRAGLVASLSLAAWYYGRKISPFILLPFVAAVSVMINPNYIWGDVGWYLSFAAFAGVMIVAPLLQDYFFGKKQPGLIRQILGETVAALIVTAPIIVLTFGQYSTYALFANLIVVPLIPLTMLAVFVTGVCGVIIPGIAPLVALPAIALLSYVVAIVDTIKAFPEASLIVELSPFLVTLFYIGLTLTLWYMWRKTDHNFRDNNLVE